MFHIVSHQVSLNLAAPHLVMLHLIRGLDGDGLALPLSTWFSLIWPASDCRVMI